MNNLHDAGEMRNSSLPAMTQEQLTNVLSFSPDALLAVDAAGNILDLNEQAAAFFGYQPHQLVGHAIEELIPAEQQALHRAHRTSYFHHPAARSMGTGLPLFGQRQDGHQVPVDISLRPVTLDGQVLALAAVRDMSQQRHLEGEVRQAQREREQQAEQLRLHERLLTLSHDAILLRDPLSRATWWNRGAEQLYGWSEQEALGRITHALLETRFPIDQHSVDKALEREGFWEGELTHTCKDGRTVVVESRQSLVRTDDGEPQAIIEINRDITRRRALEQQAQLAHGETLARLSFLQEVLDALPSSLYLVHGHDARLLLANRVAQSFWGTTWPPERAMQDFLTNNGVQLLDQEGGLLPSEQYATLRAVQRGETVVQLQEIIRRPDGSRLPILVNAVPLTTQPVTGALHDLEERVALVMHQDVSVLKEAEALKDEFIAVAAHELRNPIGVLKGYAEMLLRQSTQGRGSRLASWQREALEDIEQATARLEKLTDDLLDATRLQAGRLVLAPALLDLVEMTGRMVQQLQRSTTNHTLSLRPPPGQVLIEADRTRLEQVLTNLLSNAIKYSPDGGPIELAIEEQDAGTTVVLSVRDHGIGIPAEQQRRIFGRFVRADNARELGVLGSGLGLYVSRELIERHGGQLWFHSIEGKGTTFFVRLPRLSFSTYEEFNESVHAD